MTDDGWNPSIVTPDGDAVDFGDDHPAVSNGDEDTDDDGSDESADYDFSAMTALSDAAEERASAESEALSCPDCGRRVETEAEQHDCMRRHARNRADTLARKAGHGIEVLHL